MSLRNAIRHAMGGAAKPRAETPKPDEEEDEKPDAEAAEAEPSDEKKDEPEAEGDKPEEEDGKEEDKSMSASERAAFARGRSAERKRIGAILGSAEADANAPLAAHLAFKSDDSATKVLSTLKAAGASAAQPSGLSNRMGARQQSQLGRGGESSSRAKDAGAVWGGAIAKAGVAKKSK